MLVMAQLIEKCKSTGIQISQALPLSRGFKDLLQKEISKCDMVIINGEGTMHHDMPGALTLAEAGIFAKEQGKPVALINTVWEGNKTANRLLPVTSMIYARESLSAVELSNVGFPAAVVPDLALSCPADRLFLAPDTVQLTGSVLVFDDIRYEAAMLLAKYARSRGLQFYRMSVRPSLRSMAAVWKWARLFLAGGGRRPFTLHQIQQVLEASVVVTGRFHGVCMAILAKRPFVAVSSNTHKIEGLLADAHLDEGAVLLTDSDLLRNPFEKIDKAVQGVTLDCRAMKRYSDCCISYTESAKNRADQMFSSIATLVRNQ